MKGGEDRFAGGGHSRTSGFALASTCVKIAHLIYGVYISAEVPE